jgi:dGTPase
VLRSREIIEDEERERLGPWAVKSADSLGRGFDESEHPYRTCFQRDRDRIVHSRAFRRLEYKTQLFVHHEGDNLRNRLTHTLEAAQINRTIARALRLNEELAEAVVLAHDLGHTPFGHAGERVLDLLEERSPAFRGLNLSSETRECILKHGCDWAHPVPLPAIGAQPTLEAQVADHADEIAYTNHDLDDGLRSGLLALEALDDLALWREVRSATLARFADANERIAHAKTISALIDHLVTDLLEASAARLEDLLPGSVETVRSHPHRLVGFHPETAEKLRELKSFLYENLYHHPRVLERSGQAGPVIGDLFHHYRAHVDALPDHVRALCELDGEERGIADYVAGMTDRFALQEHRQLLELQERR